MKQETITPPQSSDSPTFKWSRFLPTRAEIKAALPGLLIVVLPIVILAQALFLLEKAAGVSWFVTVFISAVLGLIVGNVFTLPARVQPGLKFATAWFLRLGIVLYGLKFTYAYLFQTGWQQLSVVVLTVVLAWGISWTVGRRLGLSDAAAALIGTGTAICGVSAILATAPGIHAEDEDSGVAIGTILLWGSLGLLLYPLAATLWHIPPAVYGAWSGASLHDLPQIVAAAQQGGGTDGLQAALFVKMIRIAFIILVVLGQIFYFAARTQKEGEENRHWTDTLKNFPLFVLLFFLVVVINTLTKIPESIAHPLATGQVFFGLNLAGLSLMIAVAGITTRVTRPVIAKAGKAALLTGLIAWFVQSAAILTVSWLFFG